MSLLEGSIAFALAMAGLGTLCSALVEILQRSMSWRSEGLRVMLEAYYQQELKPKLKAQAADQCKPFVDALMNNVLNRQIMQAGSWFGFTNWWRTRMLPPDDLSTEQFLKRLPDSPLFQMLKATDDYKSLQSRLQDDSAAARALVERLAHRYDQFGESASAYFKSRARMVSMLVGIALALVCNINAMRIFDAFVKNPDLAARMQAQTETIRAAVEQQAARAQIEPGGAPNAETLRKIETELADTAKTLENYRSLGLPIGWEFYPNCHPATQDPKCARALAATKRANKSATSPKPASAAAGGTSANAEQGGFLGADADLPGNIFSAARADFGGFAAWLLVIVLSGGLIGLGGPFWFGVVAKLSPLKGLDAAKTQAPAATPEQLREQAIAMAAAELAPPAPAAGNVVLPGPAAAAPPAAKRPWEDKEW
ncbi:MAG: hypothetical protein KF778_08140 [Rhodocyclaceae bacterium]|nr:hypothetical protein [Rhodocyclaceae bacterium]MBX3668359.1 hypothetical protein [Rhodocyclaceae bacterium]